MAAITAAITPSKMVPCRVVKSLLDMIPSTVLLLLASPTALRRRLSVYAAEGAAAVARYEPAWTDSLYRAYVSRFGLHVVVDRLQDHRHLRADFAHDRI